MFPESEIMYAVTTPELGKHFRPTILSYTISRKANLSRCLMCKETNFARNWKQLYGKGYRCIKVVVSPVLMQRKVRDE